MSTGYPLGTGMGTESFDSLLDEPNALPPARAQAPAPSPAISVVAPPPTRVAWSAAARRTLATVVPIMLADAFPNAHVDAVDVSHDALAVAQRNVTDYELKERITLVESDLYNKVPKKKYDLIVTNPPYVNSTSMARLLS